MIKNQAQNFFVEKNALNSLKLTIRYPVKKVFKVTEHNLNENYKLFLIVTIFAKDAVAASVHVLD